MDGIKQEVRGCFETDFDNIYLRLLNGTQILNKYLCCNTKFRKIINANEKCLIMLHEKYLDCEGPDDWYEVTNETQLCQTLNEILYCNYQKTVETCGSSLAHHLHNFSLKVHKAVLKANCDMSTSIEPIISEPLTHSSAAAAANTNNNINFLMILLQNVTLVCVAWILNS